MKIIIIGLLLVSFLSWCVEKPITEQSIHSLRMSYVQKRFNQFSQFLSTNKIKMGGLAAMLQRLAHDKFSPFEDQETMTLANIWHEKLMNNTEVRQKKEAYELHTNKNTVSNSNDVQLNTIEYVQTSALALTNLFKEECPEFQIPDKISSPENDFLNLIKMNETLPITALRSVAAMHVVLSMLQYPS